MTKTAGVVTGLAALMLVAMCQRSPAPVADAKSVDPSLAVQPMLLDGERAVVLVARAACRARPSAKSALIVRLSRGARLEVLDRRDGWMKVSPTGEPCWVAASQIDDAPAPDRAPVTLYAPNASDGAPITRRRSATAISRPKRSTGVYSGGSCPCGSGNVCIGPRGGRYCITPGGNKRYGM